MKESRFKKFTEKLRAEGYGKDSARRIAAVEGAKKYGWHGMAERAAHSREAKERAA